MAVIRRILGARLRNIERRRGLGLAPLTIFILAFSTLYVTFHIITVVNLSYCQLALVWLDGWSAYGSIWQLFCLAIICCSILWLLFPLTKGARAGIIEFCFQGLLIGAMAFTLLMHKAYLIPYGQPSWAQMDRLGKMISPVTDLIWVEESEDTQLPPWPFDVPPPPYVPPNPDRDITINLRPLTMQPPLRAPVDIEFVRLRQCVSRHEEAREVYLEALEAFWRWDSRYGNYVPRRAISEYSSIPR